MTTLKFIIVGGGLAGVASAYALRRAGHQVLVLEQSDGQYRSTGSIRCPPNMTKVLRQWGLGKMLQGIGHSCEIVHYYSAETDEKLGTLTKAVTTEVHEDAMADFFVIQHGKLHSLLYDLAVEEGVDFRFDSQVRSAEFDFESESISAILATGERIRGNIIVAADGHFSQFRHYMPGDEEEVDDVQPKRLHLTITVPTETISREDDLRSLANPILWNFWLGDGFVLHSHPINEGKDYTVTITSNYSGETAEDDKCWNVGSGREKFTAEMRNIADRPRKHLWLGTDVCSRITTIRPCLESLVAKHLVLVGEAAHSAMEPGSHYPTAIVFEDAQTLGCLFARITSKDQISQFLSAYDEIRLPHSIYVNNEGGEFYAKTKVPKGPMQADRDKNMKRTLIFDDGGRNEEAIQEIYEGEMAQFKYDAKEAVEEWWNQYGRTIAKHKGMKEGSILSDLKVSLCKDEGYI